MKTSEKLSAWASFAEIVSGIAVVVTLVLLIVEVQENTETIRTAAQQEAASIGSGGFQSVAEGNMVDIFARQIAGEPLSPAEAIRVSAFSAWALRTLESQHLVHESGNLDAEERRALRYRTQAAIRDLPIVMGQIAQCPDCYTPQFRAWMESVSDDPSLEP